MINSSYLDRASLVNCAYSLGTARITRTRAGEAEGGGGGHSRIKITGMLVGKLESDPLKQTNLGVAQLYFTPKEDLTPFVMFIYEFAFGPTPSDSF